MPFAGGDSCGMTGFWGAVDRVGFRLARGDLRRGKGSSFGGAGLGVEGSGTLRCAVSDHHHQHESANDRKGAAVGIGDQFKKEAAGDQVVLLGSPDEAEHDQNDSQKNANWTHRPRPCVLDSVF